MQIITIVILIVPSVKGPLWMVLVECRAWDQRTMELRTHANNTTSLEQWQESTLQLSTPHLSSYHHGPISDTLNPKRLNVFAYFYIVQIADFLFEICKMFTKW